MLLIYIYQTHLTRHYTLAVSGVYIVIGLSVSPSSYFVNISQTTWAISIIFCMQLLFRIKDDAKFRFGPKSIKGFVRDSISELPLLVPRIGDLMRLERLSRGG